MEAMRSMWKEIDELLRRQKASHDSPGPDVDQMNPDMLLKASLLLGLCYGACMGLFGALNGNALQIVASAYKVPLLFLLTVAVTFPSLYVFTALTGSRQGPQPLLRAVLAAGTINLAVLASLGPITGFFTLTTTSYPFMRLLNAVFFGIAGGIALTFLQGSLLRMETASTESGKLPGRKDAPASGGVQQVFMVWLGLYMLVSLQMCWVLRPLIGDPKAPFVWLCPRGGNPFTDFFTVLGKLFGS